MKVFGKSFETQRFKAVKGLPLPSQYNSKWAITSLRKQYGDDAVVEIEQVYRDPANYQAFVGGDLAMKCAALEKEVAQLREENKRLKRQRENPK